MDKINKYLMFSGIFILIIIAVTYLANGIISTDISAVTSNKTFNNSDNDTQSFIFKFVNATQATASCSLYYDSTLVGTNSTVNNNTNTAMYSNTSLGSDGRHTWYVTCTNTTTGTLGTQDFILDTTSPTGASLHAPIDNYNSSSNTVTFTISGVDNIGDYYASNNLSANITVDDAVNTTITIPNDNVQASTSIAGFADGSHVWNITVYDNASNSKNSSSFTFTVDTTAPVLAGYTGVNVSGSASTNYNMIYRLNFTSADALMPISNAYVTIYQNGVAKNVSGIRTVNATGLNVMNQIDIYPSDITSDGYFIVEPHANDSLGNDRTGTNQTNWTKVTLNIGWNVIQATNNDTLYGVGTKSTAITTVSLWSNQNKNWTNYVVGSATNNATAVTDGDAVYVYTQSNIGLLRKWEVDVPVERNITVYTGWNTASAYNDTIQLYQLCQESTANASITIQAVSFYNSSGYSSQLCSLTTGWNNNITVPRGSGYLLNVNGTATYTRVR